MFTLYRARRIHTFNPARPEGTHMAVRDGRILGVGSHEELAGWGEHVTDDRLADKVLLPGFVEGHSHLGEGVYWRFIYCGYFDRVGPDGRVWTGVHSIEAMVQRLLQVQSERPADTGPLVAWGFDPIYFTGRRCNRHDLDRVSTTRPIALMHASGHITNGNSLALELAGLLRPGVDHPGILLGPDGLPNGELRGPDAMSPVLVKCGVSRDVMAGDTEGALAFGQLAIRKGVTTATDLASSINEKNVESLLEVTGRPDYPVALVPAMHVRGQTVEQAVERALALKARSTDRLLLGRMKAHADGSIQGFSARLRWPGYYNGAPQGLWYVEPEYLRRVYALAMEHGLQVHTHTNGDAAIDLALDCIESALQRRSAPDHRFMLQHCQMADRAQLQRMKALGVGGNFFANHHFYWGDSHYGLTLGPDRAERMNPCRSAHDLGVHWTIHSDAPVTPLGPLHVAWCAVNRLTASGRLLGAHERVSVHEALQAVTLGAAWSLHLDQEVGTLEAGKRADVAVLEDDPFEIDPARLKDVRVWGTMQGGRLFAAPPAQ